MHRSEKIDSAASERLVFLACPQKLSIIHKNGNFICRWREKMLDVDHPGLSESLQKKAINEANIIIERYQKYQKTFNRLHALLYRFKVIFGEEKTKPFYDLSKVTSDILNAARRLGSLWQRSNRIKNEKEAKIARDR